MFNHTAQGLGDHPCDRWGNGLIPGWTGLVNDLAVGVIDAFDQIRLLPLTLSSKDRICGSHISQIRLERP